MRNLTKALTVVSLLAPVSGHSLGIGDIRVRSALNQNLNAEIALVASKGEKPSNIKVNLAPAEKFDEAGVPWTYFLSKLKFNTVIKPNGAMVIKVTSREALKEPYLNFLVEVTWPKGNLYREFTVLVDPPTEYQQPAFQEPVYQESTYIEPSRYETGSAQRQEYTPRPRPLRRSSQAKPRRNSAGNYGGKVVTRRNDTLWKVAARVRGSGVSVEQMMMALYDNNPHAFYEQNVNALSAGKTLKVPGKDVVQQNSRESALDEFARHNSAWNNNRSGVTGSRLASAKEENVDSQLKLEAPAEATVSANETVSPSSEQAPETKNTASTAQKSSSESKESSKETSSAVDDALQSKVAALEKQMAMMQELINLKDKQLAELQNPGQQPSPSTQITATPTEPQTPAKPPETVQATPEPTPPPVIPAQPTQTAPLPPSQPVKPVAPVKPIVKPVIKQMPPTVTEEPSSPLPWILGGLGALVLPLFGWLWWQKKKIIEETEAESMFRNYTTMRNSESVSQLSSMARKSTSGAVSAESSFLNDFKASDFESFESFNVDHGDIDPLEEADVYLAYGRFQQAEDLIRQAIKSNPERDECKLKLLEIFHANSNKQDFEEYAFELAAAGKKEDNDFWRKVTALSKDICPDSPLFSQAISSTAAVFPTEPDVLAENVLFDSSVQAQEQTTKAASDNEHTGTAKFEISGDEIEETMFKIDDLETVFKQEASKEPAHVNDVNPLNIDLNSFAETLATQEDIENELLNFDLGPYPGTTPEQKTTSPLFSEAEKPDANAQPDLAEGSKDEIESYDFDFSFDDTKSKLADNLPATEAPEIIDTWDPNQTIDFSLESSLEKEPADNGMIDFSFDLEPSLSETDKALVQESEFEVSDLTDMDEIETKLDLAKAYIDMGDVESAKDIIGQVLAKGSTEQKKSAMTLLDDINLS